MMMNVEYINEGKESKKQGGASEPEITIERKKVYVVSIRRKKKKTWKGEQVSGPCFVCG